MKNKSSKLRKLEQSRYSIITDNLEYCYVCGRKAVHIHEVYDGAYRIASMKYGCCLPLCFECHRYMHDNPKFAYKYEIMMENRFNEVYPDLDFHDYFFYKKKS